ARRRRASGPGAARAPLLSDRAVAAPPCGRRPGGRGAPPGAPAVGGGGSHPVVLVGIDGGTVDVLDLLVAAGAGAAAPGPPPPAGREPCFARSCLPSRPRRGPRS